METVIKNENLVIVTERDIRIMKMLSDGYHNKRIAEELPMNIRTLELQLQRLRDKYGCTTTHQLIATFFRHKLID